MSWLLLFAGLCCADGPARHVEALVAQVRDPDLSWSLDFSRDGCSARLVREARSGGDRLRAQWSMRDVWLDDRGGDLLLRCRVPGCIEAMHRIGRELFDRPLGAVGLPPVRADLREGLVAALASQIAQCRFDDRRP